jgi:hypothetical protein
MTIRRHANINPFGLSPKVALHICKNLPCADLLAVHVWQISKSPLVVNYLSARDSSSDMKQFCMPEVARIVVPDAHGLDAVGRQAISILTRASSHMAIRSTKTATCCCPVIGECSGSGDRSHLIRRRCQSRKQPMLAERAKFLGLMTISCPRTPFA